MNSKEDNIERVIRRMLADRSTDAPAGAIKYAKDLYRTRVAEPKASVLQRVMAVMKVDLAPNRAAFGERSAGTGQARQVLFDTGDNAVDLRIAAVDKGFDIRGQVLGSGSEDGAVELVGKAASASGKLANGTFRLGAVPAGVYSLSIRCGGKEIFIDKLTVG